MTMSFEAALAYLREQGPASPGYQEACEVIASNADRVPYRVFIHLPGGMSGNNDPAWDTVKAVSDECCNCGNERVFEPREMRHDFEPSAADPIVLSADKRLYIRPVGAPASAAYMMLEITSSDNGPFLICMADPMSTSFDLGMLFSTPGYYLSDVKGGLDRRQSKPLVMMRDLRHVKDIPVVGITAVDPEGTGTITIVLDAAVEAFDPDQEREHAH